MTIGIIDYGVGNLGSIANMLKRVGAGAERVSTIESVNEATKLILPGIGSFGRAMELLLASGLVPAIERRAFEDKIPILGICVGLQMLTKHSSEGDVPGLGWIDAETRRFEFSGEDKQPVPHLGWNYVQLVRPCPLTSDLPDEPRFYFAHSYHVLCNDPELAVLTTEYGYNFTSAINASNIFGVQFHPEKSHKFGMKLMQNFAAL